MAQTSITVDSGSTGDGTTFQSLSVLEEGLAALRPAPRDTGRVALLVRRAEGGRRETHDRVSMTPDSGVPGDAWGRQRRPAPAAQLTVMQVDVAELLANGQPLVLFGDNLFLDLDLSTVNLPPGSRLRAGSVTLEVTPVPHDGCRTFGARFGEGALRFVSKPELRHCNLRGVYMRVVEGGDMAVGDSVDVISRPVASSPGM